MKRRTFYFSIYFNFVFNFCALRKDLVDFDWLLPGSLSLEGHNLRPGVFFPFFLGRERERERRGEGKKDEM